MNLATLVPELRPIIERALRMPAAYFERDPIMLALLLGIEIGAIGEVIPDANREVLSHVAACLLMDCIERKTGNAAYSLRALLRDMDDNGASDATGVPR